MIRLRYAGTLALWGAIGCADQGKVGGPRADAPLVPERVNSAAATTGGSYTLLAQIPVSRPQDIAVNPLTDRIYVISNDYANPDPAMQGRVSVIDGATNRVVADIPVGQSPTALQMDPVSNRIYVSIYQGEIVVIDGATNAIIQRVPAERDFRFIGLDNVRDRLYGVRDAIEALDVFRASDGSSLAGLPVPVRPGPLAVNTRTDRVYFVSGASWLDDLVVVDPSAASVVAHLHIGFLLSIAVNQATNRVYAGSLSYNGTAYESSIFVIDGAANTITARIPVDVYPVDLAVDEVADRLYAVEIDAATLAVIDGASNTVVTRLPLVRWARHVGVNSQSHTVYAADDVGSLVWVYGWQAAPTGLEAVAGLVESLIQAGSLTQNDGTGLMAKLDAAASLVSDGKTVPAKGLLTAFINQVNALVASGRLSAALAAPLISAAQDELEELGG